MEKRAAVQKRKWNLKKKRLGEDACLNDGESVDEDGCEMED